MTIRLPEQNGGRLDPQGEVVFTNPENDFPKFIRYALQKDGSIVAKIANDPELKGRGPTFHLKPAK